MLHEQHTAVMFTTAGTELPVSNHTAPSGLMESEVQAKVAAMEKAAQQASEKLSAAASKGSHMMFQAALQAAQKFEHLQHLVQECSAVFEKRKATAKAAMMAAATEKPMQVWRHMVRLDIKL